MCVRHHLFARCANFNGCGACVCVCVCACACVADLIGCVAGYTGMISEVDLRGYGPAMGKIFTPCLTISALGRGLSFDLCFRQGGWVLSVIGFVSSLLYTPIGFALRRLARPEPEFARAFVVMCCIPNIVAIPITVSDFLCQQGAFDAEFMTAGAELDAVRLRCTERARAYVFLYIALDSINTFIIAFSYLALGPTAAPPIAAAAAAVEVKTVEITDEAEQSKGSSTAPSSPPPSPPPSLPEQDIPPASRLCSKVAALMRKPGTPIILSMTVGVIIGLTEPLQTALFGAGGSPLALLGFGLSQIGSAAVPLLNMMVSVSLGHKLKSLSRWSDIFGSAALGLSPRTLVTLTAGRMIIIPALVSIVLVLLQPYLPESRLLRVMLFLEAAPPTASMVVLLCVLSKKHKLGQLVAFALVPQYLVAIISLTGIVALALRVTL